MSAALDAISSIGSAISSVADEIKSRSDLVNSPPMQLALIRHRMQVALDSATKAVNDEDMDEIRLLLAAAPPA